MKLNYNIFVYIKLLRSCLFSRILTPSTPIEWLTQTFVDCYRFNKGGIKEVPIEFQWRILSSDLSNSGLFTENQQIPTEKESIVKHRENENLVEFSI